jgi:hypothetical protein
MNDQADTKETIEDGICGCAGNESSSSEGDEASGEQTFECPVVGTRGTRRRRKRCGLVYSGCGNSASYERSVILRMDWHMLDQLCKAVRNTARRATALGRFARRTRREAIGQQLLDYVISTIVVAANQQRRHRLVSLWKMADWCGSVYVWSR